MSWSLSVLKELKKRLQESQDLSLGQFQIINLDLIKKKVGPRWGDVKQRIMEASEAFIEKRLGSGDMVLRCADAFLVVFAPEHEADAEERTQKISDELNAFYLGEGGLSELEITAHLSTLDAEGLQKLLQGQSPPDTPMDPTGAKAKDKALTQEEILRQKRRVVFMPVWDCQKELIGTYFCDAIRKDGDRFLFGSRVLMGHRDLKYLFDLDKQVLMNAAVGFKKVWNTGAKCSISICAQYEVLAHQKARAAYIDLLKQIPQTMRQYLYIRVNDVPQGAPNSRCHEVFRSLEPLVSGVLAHVKLGHTNFDQFEGCGVLIFGFDQPYPRFVNGFTKEEDGYLNIITAKAGQNQAAVYMTLTQNLLTMEQARNRGVRFFSGEIIGPSQAQPEAPRLIREEAFQRYIEI